MQVSKRLGFLAAVVLMGLMAAPALGQAGGGPDQNAAPPSGAAQNGPAPNAAGENGPPRRGFEPGRGFMDYYKQQLGAGDDEFAAIEPKIQAVMQLQRDLNTGRMRGMFGRGRGGFGGFGPATQPSPVADALNDLRNTLDDPNSSPGDIKAKLDAVRAVRAKVKQDLAVAQQDLKSLLTQRQEAVMVLLGVLD